MGNQFRCQPKGGSSKWWKLTSTSFEIWFLSRWWLIVFFVVIWFSWNVNLDGKLIYSWCRLMTGNTIFLETWNAEFPTLLQISTTQVGLILWVSDGGGGGCSWQSILLRSRAANTEEENFQMTRICRNNPWLTSCLTHWTIKNWWLNWWPFVEDAVPTAPETVVVEAEKGWGRMMGWLDDWSTSRKVHAADLQKKTHGNFRKAKAALKIRKRPPTKRPKTFPWWISLDPWSICKIHTHDASMGLAYLPTWMVDFYDKCR